MARTDVRLILAAVALCVAVPQLALAQTKGKITAVRVYRGQALVTREVRFDAKAGAQEVVVTELPERVVAESLYATGDEGLAIRAVRHRMTAVEEEPRPEVRALDEQIKARQADSKRIESQLSVLEKRAQYLDKLETFSADRSTAELAEGTLNPKALTDTAKFIFEQRDEVATQQLKLEAEKASVEETLAVLQRERNALTASISKSRREAVVFLDAERAGPSRFALSYLVDGVGWSPAYSARLDGAREKLSLEYHAVVTQMSGEDWEGVSLTLSTSHPRMLAAAPLLSPLRIALVPGGAEQPAVAGVKGAKEYADEKRDLAQQIRGGYGYGAGRYYGGQPHERGPQGPPGMMGEPGPPAQTAWAARPGEEFVGANVAAARLQNLELAAPDEAVRMSKAMGVDETEGLAVDYAVAGSVSLQSRKDQQMFRIATLDLAADFYYTAAPLLTDYIYQAVEAVNTSDYPLLPGPYNAYLNGAFSGHGNLPLVARGQGLTVGFGAETQLRAARELDEKTTEIRGGNKVLSYTYRLRLRNFMDQPVQVRVWDRLPQAPDEQVTVTLADPDPPLSQDALYLAYERPRGLLRWDVEVPARAAGAQAYSFTYQFQLEFDKTYNIGELPAQIAESMQRELETLGAIRAFGGFGGLGAPGPPE